MNQITRMHWLIMVLVVSAMLCNTALAAVIIDDFEIGSFPDGALVDNTPRVNEFGAITSIFNTESGLNTQSVIAGERTAYLDLISGEQASLFVGPSGGGSFIFNVAPNSTAIFQLFYGSTSDDDPPLEADLSSGGQIGFEIVIEEATANARFFLAINSNTGQFFSPTLPLDGPGVLRILYDDIINEFGPDSVDIDLAASIFLGIFDVPETAEGATYSIQSIQTFVVPESASCISCFIAVTTLCNLRRRY